MAERVAAGVLGDAGLANGFPRGALDQCIVDTVLARLARAPSRRQSQRRSASAPVMYVHHLVIVFLLSGLPTWSTEGRRNPRQGFSAACLRRGQQTHPLIPRLSPLVLPPQSRRAQERQPESRRSTTSLSPGPRRLRLWGNGTPVSGWWRTGCDREGSDEAPLTNAANRPAHRSPLSGLHRGVHPDSRQLRLGK